jgi:catechol 2,3-dioxygenase-like lactoylglutathione lyase family enzyme
MLDHIGIGVSDFARSRAFYDKTLAPLGVTLIMEVMAEQTGDHPAAGFGSEQKPDFWFGTSPDVARAHVVFIAPTRVAVDAFYKVVLAAGGKDNGAPGLRPHYHANYYGAFVLDPDGHNIEAIRHLPE